MKLSDENPGIFDNMAGLPSNPVIHCLPGVFFYPGIFVELYDAGSGMIWRAIRENRYPDPWHNPVLQNKFRMLVLSKGSRICPGTMGCEPVRAVPGTMFSEQFRWGKKRKIASQEFFLPRPESADMISRAPITAVTGIQAGTGDLGVGSDVGWADCATVMGREVPAGAAVFTAATADVNSPVIATRENTGLIAVK
jgi:hypothetical protein